MYRRIKALLLLTEHKGQMYVMQPSVIEIAEKVNELIEAHNALHTSELYGEPVTEDPANQIKSLDDVRKAEDAE